MSTDITILPELLAEHTENAHSVLALRIPDSLAYLPGHFPGVPIVPGVAQIHWAMHFAREALGVRLEFHHMEVIKFKELIRPGQTLQLELRYYSESQKLVFAYRSGTVEFSSGRIYFHEH